MEAQVTALQTQLETAQGQDQRVELRAQTAERVEEAFREQHADFARRMNDELLRRRTTDVLAAYLQLYLEGVLVNMEELEGLITTLYVEVGQQWKTQIQLWNDAIASSQ